MYYIIEIQKSTENAYAHLVYTAESRNEADSIFYDKLHFAAVSGLPIHTVMLADEKGNFYASKSYASGDVETDESMM